ncbi:hypothetical protein CDIK_3032, partial [Cucumispora dikerogammari]
SVLAISAMYQIKYQTVHSIVKKYLKTGIINAVKRGRDRRTKIPFHVKKALIAYVDEECTRTLKELGEWLKNSFNIDVSKSTIDCALSKFHYTLKRVTVVPERRNCLTTIQTRSAYG